MDAIRNSILLWQASTARADKSKLPWLLAIALVLLLALAVLAGIAVPAAPVRAGQSIITCPLLTSIEGRLTMQRWAADDNCDRATRTRVIDRFIGFVCGDISGGSPWCRPFTPAAESRAFDSSQFYRCIDVAVTASEEGLRLNRMREWVPEEPKQCDWNPGTATLAMEIDFDTGHTCIAGLCIEVQRLSPVGKLRLRHLAEKALRELQLIDDGPQSVSLKGRLTVNSSH